MNDVVKVAKIQAKAANDARNAALVHDLAFNPIVELLLGFVAVETLQRFPQSRPIIGNMQGNMLEAGIMVAIAYQQLSPNIPAYLTAGNDLIKTVTSQLSGSMTDAAKYALPALLAAGV